MKQTVLFLTILLGAICAHADSNKEADCDINYVIDLSINKKYCVVSRGDDPTTIFVSVEKESPAPQVEIPERKSTVDTALPIEAQHEIPDPITPEERSMMN